MIVLTLLVLASVVVGLVGSDRVIASTGFILSGIGLGVSLAGFAFTIAQLRKTQSAAEAASGAIEKIKRDFGYLDAVAELQSIRSSIESAQHELSESRWPGALVPYIASDRG